MSVYRLYDGAGALLYVGITSRGTRRIGEHARHRPWWSQVARAEIEHHPDRPTALAREAALILAERPRHNRAGLPPARPAGAPTWIDRGQGRVLSRRSKRKLITMTRRLEAALRLHAHAADREP